MIQILDRGEHSEHPRTVRIATRRHQNTLYTVSREFLPFGGKPEGG